MKTTIKKSKNFKPRFLYKDTAQIKAQMEKWEEDTKYIDSCLLEVAILLDRELTIEEKIYVLNQRWEGVVNMLRTKVNFPNAKEQAIFDLLGVEPSKAKNLLGELSMYYSEKVHVIRVNETQVSKPAIAELEERKQYFTKNENQNIALDSAEKLCEVINFAIDQNVIRENELSDIVKAFSRFLSYSRTPSNLSGVAINYDQIRFI